MERQCDVDGLVGEQRCSHIHLLTGDHAKTENGSKDSLVMFLWPVNFINKMSQNRCFSMEPFDSVPKLC